VNLSHYSAEPFALDRARTYAQDSNGYKPHGLWVSVDGEDDWPSWCRAEQYAVDRLSHSTRLRLTPGANVLRLCTPRDLDTFASTYAADGYPFLDWSAVTAEYGGVVIAPYQWSRRLALSWYYSWDCASGCIWDLTAVEVVTE
jgi:hypothetical protein